MVLLLRTLAEASIHRIPVTYLTSFLHHDSIARTSQPAYYWHWFKHPLRFSLHLEPADGDGPNKRKTKVPGCDQNLNGIVEKARRTTAPPTLT
jgi:hypothetical protein